jgi:hypothetical protein
VMADDEKMGRDEEADGWNLIEALTGELDV